MAKAEGSGAQCPALCTPWPGPGRASLFKNMVPVQTQALDTPKTDSCAAGTGRCHATAAL